MMNIEPLLVAYADGELSEIEEYSIEAKLESDPNLRLMLASLYRERLMFAELVREQYDQQENSEEPPQVVANNQIDTSSFEMSPNEEIYTAYVNGTLSKAEHDEVEKQLADDKRFENEFAEFCRTRFLFAEAARSQIGVAVPRKLNVGQTPYKRSLYQPKSNRSHAWLKIAALFIALLGGFLFFSHLYNEGGTDMITDANDTRPTPEDPSPVKTDLATFVELEGKVEIKRASGIVVADMKTRIMNADEIIVRTGMATIKFDGENSTIKLRSHSSVELTASNSETTVVLSNGTLAASIEKQKNGKMLFKTRHSQMEIIGTQFLLSTSRNNTNLEVSEGSVRMSHARSGEVKMVKSGEYAVASVNNLTKRKIELEVLGLSLINAENRQPISGHETITPDGTIHLSRLGTDSLTFEINTMPIIVESMDLTLTGPQGFAPIQQKEKFYPYFLTNNRSESHWVNSSTYEKLDPPLIPGKYKMIITVRGKVDHVSQEITHSVSFTVVD